ncbi:hypothetical protein NLI96_g10518 [Meripilus lineatus]|uniref:Cytochrome P450 n=1 Tax=Meripilus lineatus TaxID=2056292 RepID=A0AAD5YE92_9APHY|nr:hypothetical protein NLI96_g10518 [Physisporinus lineatus]
MNTLFSGLVVLAVLYVWSRHHKFRNAVLPPGPKPLPLVGNILDLTARELWLRVEKWARCFGDIVYIHVFGQGLVFLNTQQAAVDLLEKQGSIYSDKPSLVMAGELCGCENMVAFTRYGDFARRQRKLMHEALGASAVRTFLPLLEIETHALVRGIMADPKDYIGYIRKYAGGLTLLVIYGYRVTSNEDPYLMLAEECVDILSNRIASGGGIWPVDIFPFLKHLPLWAPGSGFKHKAIEWRAKMEEFVEKPFQNLKEQMKNGTNVPCFVSHLMESSLERGDKAVDQQREFDVKWTANSMYSASLDTTITVVQDFLLAMMAHPEVLRKAQEEIDRVVGPGRLPAFTDRPNLPYIDCVMSEVLRWGCPVPLDLWKMMFITACLSRKELWKMLRNEEVYPDAHEFKPERFLVEVDEATAKRRDPRNFVFGFGRRRCPGNHLIEQSFWIVMTTILATLDISKAKDENGNVLEPNVVYENSVFRSPSTFQCDLRPRTEQALKIMRQTADAH